MLDDFWQYEDETEYRRRLADRLMQRYRRPPVSGALPAAPTMPSLIQPSARPGPVQTWAEQFAQRFQEPTGRVTPLSALKGTVGTVGEILSLPAEYVGVPILGALTAALTPGRQYNIDPNADLWTQMQQAYTQSRQIEHERPELFSIADINIPGIGPIHIGEKFITEGILFDPLTWTGVGAAKWAGKAAKAAKAVDLLDAAGDAAKAAKLASGLAQAKGIGSAQRSILRGAAELLEQGISKGDLLTEAAKWRRMAAPLQAIEDVTTLPMRMVTRPVGRAGREVAGAIRGALRGAADAGWARRLMSEAGEVGLEGAAEGLERMGAKLPGEAAERAAQEAMEQGRLLGAEAMRPKFGAKKLTGGEPLRPEDLLQPQFASKAAQEAYERAQREAAGQMPMFGAETPTIRTVEEITTPEGLRARARTIEGPEGAVIEVRKGLTPKQRQEAIAHELTHAAIPDVPGGEVAEEAAAYRAMGKEMPEVAAKQAMGEIPTPPKIGTTTRAVGADPNKAYNFRYKVVELDELVPSHTDALAPNKAFPRELQPRLRERAASEMQVDRIARELNPDALLDDVHQLDRGPMITGADNIVESGNGRVLALRRARARYPEQFAAYRQALEAKAVDYGIDPAEIQGMRHPVLVRERLSDVDRVAFAAEANQTAVLTMSPLEQAMQDAGRLSDEALSGLQVGAEQSAEQALKAAGNRDIVRQFVGSLSPNERGMLLDVSGGLNQAGLQRLKAAMFYKTYPGEAGQRLTSTFFESLDPGIKRIEQGLFGSLPQMAQAEGLIRAGYREAGLTLADDIARSVDVLARLREQSIPVSHYLSQAAMFERELTPFQESLLQYLDQIGKSSKKVREFIGGYAQGVMDSPPPGQATMFGVTGPTKEAILERIAREQAGEEAGELLARAAREETAQAAQVAAPQAKGAQLARRVEPEAVPKEVPVEPPPIGAPAAAGEAVTEVATRRAVTEPPRWGEAREVEPFTGEQAPMPGMPQAAGGAPPREPPGPPPPENVKFPDWEGNDLERTRAALAKPKPTFKARAQDLIARGERAFLDRLAPFADLQKRTGVPVHDMAQIVPGMAKAGQDRVDRFVRPLFEGLDVERVQELAVLKHAEELRATKGAEYILPGKIVDPATGIRKLQEELGPDMFARIEQAVEGMAKVNDEQLLRPWLEEGFISPELYEFLRTNYKYYIPFNRQDFALESDFFVKANQPAHMGARVLHALSAEGSEKALDEPLARWVQKIAEAPVAIQRNKAARTLVQALEQYGKETGQALVKMGETTETVARGTISWYNKGQKLTAQVPKIFAEVAKGLEAEPANALGRFLLTLSKPLRLGAVQANPVFMMANAIRDQLNAWFHEKLVPLSPEWFRGLRAVLAKNTDFVEAVEAGALGSGITERVRDISSLKAVRQLGGVKVNNLTDALLVVPRLIMEANEISEQATRVAVFQKLKAEGIDTLKAAIRTRDCNVDFAKSGNVTKLLNQMIPFLNAGVQGSVNTLKMIKNNPAQAAARTAPLWFASTMFHLWNQRFETSTMIPEYERANSWVIQIGEGQKSPDPRYPDQPGEKFPIYIRIPKGPAVSFLAAPAEVILNIATEQGDKSAIEHLLEGVRTMGYGMLPVEPSFTAVTPPLLGTGIQLQANRDIFRNRAIVPQGELSRPEAEQYGPETSRTAVLASQLLGQYAGLSPREIEFIVKDYTGGAGMTASWVLDVALGALGYAPGAPGDFDERELTPVEQLAGTPIAGRFLGVRATEPLRRGYDELDKALAQARKEIYTVPEAKRFGLGINAPGDTVTVNGREIALKPEQRAEILRRSTALFKVGLSDLASQSWYKELPDIDKRELVDSLRSKINANARESVAAETTGRGARLWDETDVQMLVDATGQYLEYQRIPRYRGMSEEQAAKAAAASSKMAAMRRANPMLSTEQVEAIYRRQDPEGARLARIAKGRTNPARQRYWRQHPLLNVFFGGLEMEELEQVRPSWGRTYAYAAGLGA